MKDNNVGGTTAQAQSRTQKARAQSEPGVEGMGDSPQDPAIVGAEPINPAGLLPEFVEYDAGPDTGEVEITVTVSLPSCDMDRLKFVEREYGVSAEAQIALIVQDYLEMERGNRINREEAA